MHHIGYICFDFLHCSLSNVFSKCLHNRMQSHIGSICLTFLTVHFQIYPQTACLRGCIITLFTFVILFTCVSQMCFFPRRFCHTRLAEGDSVSVWTTQLWSLSTSFATNCFPHMLQTKSADIFLEFSR